MPTRDGGALDRPRGEQVHLSGPDRKLLADSVAAILRKVVGRGPLGIAVQVANGLIILEIQGFMTALERSLVAEGQNHDLVRKIRDYLLEQQRGEWDRLFRQELGLSVVDLWGEVDVPNDRRTIIFHVKDSQAR